MDLKLNAERFTGKSYVDLYDTYRPSPPRNLLLQALNYIDKSKANIIVDLGCGTGISTEAWIGLADEIIGIEPSKEMRLVAEKRHGAHTQITFKHGYAHETNLPLGLADIVTCSQAFHWMEPTSTLKEISRLLADGGVLVIYDAVWPPSVNVQFEKAYNRLFRQAKTLTQQLNETIAHHWAKDAHFSNIKESGYFPFVKEVCFHKTEKLTKDQFIGIALSQGGLEALMKRGFTEEEIGITSFKDEIERLKMPAFQEITYSYKAIYAIK